MALEIITWGCASCHSEISNEKEIVMLSGAMKVAKLETRLVTFQTQYFSFPEDICTTCRREPTLPPLHTPTPL